MVLIQHVALCMDSKDHARSFYQDVLQAELIKEFEISKSLINEIFSITVNVNKIKVMVFETENLIFEVFINPGIMNNSFNHVCISVDNLSGFLNQCKNMNLSIFKIPKDDKNLIFIKDYSGNLFEIKEK